MRTIRRLIAHVVPLVGMGLMLTGLFGGPALPAAFAVEVEPFTQQNAWGGQSPYGYDNPWGRHDDWGPSYPWSQHDYRGQRHPRGRPDPLGVPA